MPSYQAAVKAPKCKEVIEGEAGGGVGNCHSHQQSQRDPMNDD